MACVLPEGGFACDDGNNDGGAIPRGALEANLEFNAANDVSYELVLNKAPSTAIQFFVVPAEEIQ